MAKQGLYANINRRKKLGISRPKSKSTITKKAYANMKAGFPKKKKKGEAMGFFSRPKPPAPPPPPPPPPPEPEKKDTGKAKRRVRGSGYGQGGLLSVEDQAKVSKTILGGG